MKIDQLVALIVRLFVIYLFIGVIFRSGMMLVSLISQYEGDINASTVGYAILLVSLLIVLGLLWKYALYVAKKIIPSTDGAIKTSVSFEELETLCFTVLGFWVAMDSLVITVQYLLDIEFAKFSGATVEVHLFGYIGRLAVGIWLVLGSKGIVKTIRKLRA